jgi:glycosyltransferase involved in cell wall biosynthesis
VSEHRVLHFLWSGGVGGAERAVYQVVREEVRRAEWQIGVAFGRARGPWADAIRSLGCDIVDLGMRNSLDLPGALRQIGRLRGYDIHHFHVLELCQLVASARCDGVARVFTQRHGAHELKEPLRKRMRRATGGYLLRRYLHAMSGNTEHATRYAIDRYRLQHLPSMATYNGIDFSLLSPSREREAVRSELGAGPGTILVGYSGTFNPCKRLDRLVSILGAVPEARAVLVGSGPLRGALETQSQALGVEDRLHITGFVDNVADYLLAMDVFVLPSSADESFGNSVVEAMALGVPSIVFADSPGVCEHMESGVTGYIVKDQKDLDATVGLLGRDSEMRTRIGRQGAQHVRSKYTLENMHQSYGRLYEAALDGQATAHDR